MEYLIEDGFLAEVYPPFEKNEVIPDGPECIGEAVFARCGEKDTIESIVIPDSVIEIEEHAFNGCAKLKTVTIGKGIKKIAKDAFAKCGSLTEVRIAADQKKVKIHPNAFPKKTTVTFGGDKTGDDKKAPGYDMKLADAKKKYTVSKRDAGYSINEFNKDGRIQGPFRVGTGYDYRYEFSRTVEDKRVFIPETLDGKTVCHVAVKTLPEDAIVLCNASQFGKLGRAQKVSTACAWLKGTDGFQEDEIQVIGKFIKGYAEDVARVLAGQGNAEAFARFVELAKPKATVLQTVLDEITVDTETKAILLDKLGTATGSAPSASLESKPMSSTELKKLWTMKTLTDGATGEKYIELSNYKGSSGEVVVPAFVGKTPVRWFSCVMPAHVTKVDFETDAIEIKGSFRNCAALADKDGFVVVHAGARSILTDYIGPKDVEILTIPEGVTENSYGAFRNLNIRRVSLPRGYEKLAGGTFANCEYLQSAELPNGLKEIGQLAFDGCRALKEIYIPASVETIGFFDFQKNAEIYGEPGSAAQAYAEEHAIPFHAGRIPPC